MAKNLVQDLILTLLTNLGHNFFFFFLWILPLLEIGHCCKLSLYAISRKTNEPNLKKWLKKDGFWLLWPKFGSPIFFFFFFKNLASSVTRYHGQLSSCTISEKTNGPILRKLSDGRKDGRGWFHRALPN